MQLYLYQLVGIRNLMDFSGDPGFPLGGGVDSRGSYVLKTLYVKMKESGPFGGGGGMRRARPL